ncbi:MLO-like protein 6 isoform X1 [Arachis stenosperma]|uniref:MLO-like protein 6 isoform X1 n=1 Tax=Arachis stenosperma TaxID=217475 RepID=UPI0025AC8ACD|nr:MLO-like protein 6 isoform X1 [Arachis stenosperma]
MAAGEQEEQRTLEETPTWAVSICCFFFILLSLSIEAGLHKLSAILKKNNRRSLGKALAKIKTEMIKYGFISFLLTISQQIPLSKICVREAVANSFLPCSDPPLMRSLTEEVASWDFGEEKGRSLNATANEVNYCESKGMVSLISNDGIQQLNIFIVFLAVFHISSCTLTMCLGMAKMRRWKKWENETQTLEYQIAHDSSRFQYTRQTSVGKRHLNFWSNYSPLLWMVCFLRQFYRSVSKDDYFTLRNGFIAANISVGGNFNFMKFLSRTYDQDFEKIVRIRSWIWIFSILFIFFSAHEFYNHYWLPFIPLVVAIIGGTKLQVVITNMCVDSVKEKAVIKGTILVKPNDDYFWFGRPEWLLYLIQFILLQTSFQLAFFAWTWYEFGPRSCFNREVESIAIHVIMGVTVQILCGYVTLPLYALVTQMGSGMRSAVFTERVTEGLKSWHKRAKQSVSNNNSTSSKYLASLHSRKSESSIKENLSNRGDSRESNENTMHPLPLPLASGSGEEEEESTTGETQEEEISTHSISEIKTVEEEENENNNDNNNQIIVRGGTFIGEASFGSSWKNMDSPRTIISKVGSVTEEDDNISDIYLT